MKPARLWIVVSAFVILFADRSAMGQVFRPPNRGFNQFAVQMKQAWDVALTDPVKLIEIGPVTDDGRNRLLMMTGGTSATDFKRKLLIARWNGGSFYTDATYEFLGTNVDVLLEGYLRPPKAVTPAASQTTKKRKAPRPVHQIVTTEGVYEWNGHEFLRLFNAPAELKLEAVLDGATDELIGGAGITTASYQIGDAGVHASSLPAPTDGGGYVRYGSGTQPYPGSDAMDIAPGIRFVQSVWNDQHRWFICVQHVPVQTGVNNSIPTDRVIVYTPVPSHQGSFWSTRQADLQASWRSDPLPGSILDVRVGDPKNDGDDGILVLTSENKDKDRHLYFFTPVQRNGIGG